MQLALHHYHKRKMTSSTKRNKRFLTEFLDKVIYIVGISGVLVFVPQFVSIWSNGSIAGVSLISWLGMLVASMFWIFYGIVHKAKPILVINVLAAALQFGIVLGILLHK